MTRRRKILYTFLLALIAGGVAYYFFIYKKSSDALPAPTPLYGVLPEPLQRLLGIKKPGQTPGGSVTPTPDPRAERQKQKLFKLSHEPAFAPVIASDTKRVRYFSRVSGALFEVDFDGLDPKRISDMQFVNLSAVTWSRTGDKALMDAASPTELPRKFIYDVASKKFSELNRSMHSADFSPAGDRIVYQHLNVANGDHWLATAKTDGSDEKKLFRPMFDDYVVAWPRQETTMIETRPSYASLTHLYAVTVKNGRLNKMLPQDHYGLSALWSPDGSKFIATRSDADGALLNAVVGVSSRVSPGELFGFMTLSEKCAWHKDNKRVVCGIPMHIPYGTKLPDDYYMGNFVSTDNVTELNVETQATKVIARSQDLFPALDIESPVLSADGSMMFFMNRQDSFIYALRLQM